MGIGRLKRKQKYLGQTKSSLYRRIKRAIRTWRRNRRKLFEAHKEIDFLDVIDDKRNEKQLKSKQEDGYEVIEKDE